MEMAPWSFGTLYGAIKAIDTYISAGKNVYVHCAGGACRSVAVAELWLYAKGYSFQEARLKTRPQETDEEEAESEAFVESITGHKPEPRLTAAEGQILQGKIDPQAPQALRWALDPKNPPYAAQGVVQQVDPNWNLKLFRAVRKRARTQEPEYHI